jgi:hypothetical protein
MLKLINSIKISDSMVTPNTMGRINGAFIKLSKFIDESFNRNSSMVNIFAVNTSKIINELSDSKLMHAYKVYASDYWLSKMYGEEYIPRIQITPILLREGKSLKFTIDIDDSSNESIIFENIDNREVFEATSFFIRKYKDELMIDLYEDDGGEFDIQVNFIYSVNGILQIIITQWCGDEIIKRNDYSIDIEENNIKLFKTIGREILSMSPATISTQRLVPFIVLQGKQPKAKFGDFSIEESICRDNNLWVLIALIELNGLVNNVTVRSNKSLTMYKICPICLSKQPVDKAPIIHHSIDIPFNPIKNTVKCRKCKTVMDRVMIEPLTLHELLKREYD